MAELLRNKVAVVTGASSGIGRAIVEKFVAEGASVIAFARSKDKLDELSRAHPGAVVPVAGDVTCQADIQALADEAARRFGKVDAVIPNAGIARAIPFEQSTREVIAEQFEVNYVGASETVRLLLPHINEGGSVIFMTTFLTQSALGGLTVYSASKAALSVLTRTLAAELAPRGIRVNAVAPGPITTPLWGEVGLPPDVLEQVAAQVTGRLFPGKFGDPEDIAATTAFLCSDGAKNIFGQEIIVDGGYVIG